jgi:hypothetical protein
MKKILVSILLYLFVASINQIKAQNQSKMPPGESKNSLNKREVNQILKNNDLKTRNDLKDEENSKLFDFYELTDGRILVVVGFGNGTGIMYNSEEELKKTRDLKDSDVRKNGEHVLSDLIPSNTLFLQKKADYIHSLSQNLNIPGEKLDYSLQSLKLIDSSYKRNRPDKNLFFRNDYLYLIAYIGEVFKAEEGGEWFFEKKPQNQSFEPFIKVSESKILNPFWGLFKECYENYDNFSIYGFASAQLQSKRLSR